MEESARKRENKILILPHWHFKMLEGISQLETTIVNSLQKYDHSCVYFFFLALSLKLNNDVLTDMLPFC